MAVLRQHLHIPGLVTVEIRAAKARADVLAETASHHLISERSQRGRGLFRIRRASP
jgi:hypothetical protein